MELINVSLDAFEGPLDLLLHLIEKNEIDIYDIPIAKLTDQYMAYINAFSAKNMDQLCEFLVMAATLLEIKSKMLLPSLPKDIEEEVDPREALVNRLIEYKRFRNVLHEFKEREVVAERFVYRPPEHMVIDLAKSQTPVNFDDLLVGITADKLFAIFDETLQRRAVKIDIVHSGFNSITKDTFTVEEKMENVLNLLLLHKKIDFLDLFGAYSRKIEKVVTFLAILELAKLKKIKIQQNDLFDCIEIVSN